MIVAADIGEVGIAAGQGEDDRIRPIGLDVRHCLQQGFGRGFGIRAHVVAVGGDDILGGEALAVVEGHALQELEAPGLGPVDGLHAFDEIRRDVALGVDLGEAVGHGAPEGHLGPGIGIAGGVEGIGGGAMGKAEAGRAALLRRRRHRLAEHRLSGRHADTGGQSELDELAPARLSGAGKLFHVIDVDHCNLPVLTR